MRPTVGPTLGENVARIRRQRQLTQEQLAAASGLSMDTIGKLERGARTTARMNTIGALARALKVSTSSLLGDGSAAVTRREPGYASLGLLDLRRALTPVAGADGRLLDEQADSGPPNLERARLSVEAANEAYHRNDFGTTAAALPGLLAEVRTLVADTDGDDQLAAHVVASQAYHLAGRLLIQLRVHDLAYVAVTAARQQAAQSGDVPAVAAAAWPMCWLLLRQGRLAEAEGLATSTADEVEPRHISRASTAEVEAWSWMLLEAAAAMSRDGRDDDATRALDMASVAATRIDNIDGQGVGAAKVAMARVEAAAIAGDPRRVLQLSERITVGRPAYASCWQRHRLDVAWAHAELAQWPAATGVLVDLGDRAPTWLRHQRYAQDIVGRISTGRKRAHGDKLAQLATLVGMKS
ncbi:helix-turn-helix transcriptional regulator [Micromonospora sp. WMMD1102]|uniref:helix-turn-helix domain-containing protein n=1 Tax=Micromonospora sp. WMMD1102 TaxID=3016105 RepID=UPI0024153489|nr:helix-turn-helix transcriptional regulator [Micromonospora sp. WMMD1102]MDG4787137.1 helix-turn-helix transcriptional regulator [Micromonospora sp. WMMD1102]